jgi:hypothetical protein
VRRNKKGEARGSMADSITSSGHRSPLKAM